MLYLFDKNENLIHELASFELESLIQHEELNKLMTLEFSVFIDSNYKMKNIEYVAHKDMEDYQKIQMYRIISSESDDYTVNYQAVHIIFDELKAYGYIRDKRPDKVKASAALNIALAGSRWKVGRVDDSDLLSTSFYDLTRLDALSKIIKTWNLDLHFYSTFDGNKITGRYIDLLGFRGEDTGERFVYGSNALEVVKEVDVSDVYTRVIPRGKGEEKLDEEGKPTDGYGRRIKIDDVLWEKSKGDPIDKPKGQEFLELKEMTEKFGFSDGEARTRVQIFDDIEDPKELIKAGYDFLVQVSRPLVQFKTKISKRSRTNVGDIVRIIRKDLDFYYRTRIYKAHRNLLNETLEVEFGDKLVQSPADRQKIVSDSLNSLEERIKETETDLKSSFVDKVNEGITHATFNRDGYNYELKKGNKYGLPAGYYSFDREIDDNPQRVIYVGAGTLAIADSKKSNGDWNFRTFGTGQGFVADLLVAGTILGGKVRWNLEDGTLLIGNSPDDYNLYWDGETLNLRNTKIDFRYDKNFIELKNNIDKKISKEDILEDKEIQEALKGKDGPPGEKGKDGQDGKPGKDGKSGRLGKNLLLDSFKNAEGTKYFLINYDYAEKIEEGEELTLTIKIDKALEESTSLSAYNGKDTLLGELIQSEKDKTKYVLTFNYLDSADDIKKLYIYINNPTEKSYAIKWAVLARGDVEALDWYGAEEDMQKQIDSKASEESLQDLQVHFAMYPTAEELNQNKVDLIKQQAYLDQLKTAIDSNALTLEERLSVIEANVGAGKLSLEAINTYLHFGEEGVLIGKEGEQVRLRLINNALEITDGTKVVARFANNQTETPNLKVTGAFEFGYHVANKVDLDGNKYTVISSNI